MSASPTNLTGPFELFLYDGDLQVIDNRLRPVVRDVYAFDHIDHVESDEKERMQWICDALNEAWRKHTADAEPQNSYNAVPWAMPSPTQPVFTTAPIVVSPWHLKAGDLYELAVCLKKHAQEAQDRYAVDAEILLAQAERVLKETLCITLPEPTTSIKSDWKPIATAPHGAVLLVGYNNSSGHWRSVRGQWFSAEHIAENWENIEDDAHAKEMEGWYEMSVECTEEPNCWPITPTHWMHLPNPPLDR